MKITERERIHSSVIAARRELCYQSKCEYLDKLNYADPCAACPNGHWGRYEDAGCEDPTRAIPVGLGDKIARIAQPIAEGIDRVFGTTIRNCGGCKGRQQKLNQIFPGK